MEEKKLNQILFLEFKIEESKTIFKVKNRKCVGCEKFINQSSELPKIQNTNEQVISQETAYQMTTILRGAVERGTAKKLRALNVPLAGKTGTTNDNFDAWFIGFHLI